MSFKLKSAKVHYGMSSYPLHGLPARYDTIESANSVSPTELADVVGRLTSFRRDFTVRHIDEQVFDLPSGKLTIPEQVYAFANGYSIVWERAA